MPELPEVETIRRDLEAKVAGRRITSVWLDRGPHYGRLDGAVGRLIRTLKRRGKYLLFDLEDRELVVHLGMSGQLFLAGTRPSSHHLRALFELEGSARSMLSFVDMRRFGTLRLVLPGSYVDLPTLANLGPEPLSDDFLLEPFVRALAKSKAPIKTLLLAQKVVAGLGNIYSDEVLHRAGIHPNTRGLRRRQATQLYVAIRAVLHEAVSNRGTTFDLYRDGNEQPGNHYTKLEVFDRKGALCRRCGFQIAKIRVAGRGTHLCPHCQPE